MDTTKPWLQCLQIETIVSIFVALSFFCRFPGKKRFCFTSKRVQVFGFNFGPEYLVGIHARLDEANSTRQILPKTRICAIQGKGQHIHVM